ncbi:uncharacterized protein LOC142355276 [Convolutriloba macropyga]|uniref:uncharacterized protein LOC142355276 n=1 Tax=Convolutriloba macropyga TaxID=536237 RepID=UPI003F527D4C
MASWLLTIFLPLTLISSSRVSAEIVADVNEIELTSFLINLRLDESEKDSTIGGIGDIKCQDFTDDIQCPTDLNLTEIISDTGDSASVVVGNLEPGKAYDIQFLEVQLNSGNHSWTRNVTVRQCTVPQDPKAHEPILRGGELINTTYYFDLWTTKYQLWLLDSPVDDFDKTGRPMRTNLPSGKVLGVKCRNVCHVEDPVRGLVITTSALVKASRWHFITTRAANAVPHVKALPYPDKIELSELRVSSGYAKHVAIRYRPTCSVEHSPKNVEKWTNWGMNAGNNYDATVGELESCCGYRMSINTFSSYHYFYGALFSEWIQLNDTYYTTPKFSMLKVNSDPNDTSSSVVVAFSGRISSQQLLAQLKVKSNLDDVGSATYQFQSCACDGYDCHFEDDEVRQLIPETDASSQQALEQLPEGCLFNFTILSKCQGGKNNDQSEQIFPIVTPYSKVKDLKQTERKAHSIKLSWQDDGNYPNEHFEIVFTAKNDPTAVFTAVHSFNNLFVHAYEFESSEHLWLPRDTQFICTVYAVCDVDQCLHGYREPVSIPCSTSASDGKPTHISHEILTDKSVRVSWRAPDTFVSSDVTGGDYNRYNIYLNNVLKDTVVADQNDLSSVVAPLDICQMNEVTIEAITDQDTRQFTAKTIVLDWNDNDSVRSTLSRFPHVAERCGFCPNEDLTALCIFPRRLYDQNDKSQYCWEDEQYDRALCRDVMNRTQHCNRDSQRCFETETKLTNVSVDLSGGQLELKWDQNRSVYSQYLVIRNGHLWSTQREKRVLITDMEYKETVKIQLKTYRGISDYITIFTSKSLNDRQSSILIGPGHNYARLFWTPFSADISANISKIEIELSIQPQSVHNLFFSANEIATRVIERTDPNSFNDSVVLDDLIRGIGYTAVVRVIGEQGSELESLTTITDFYTEPSGLFVPYNRLKMEYEVDRGLHLTGILNKFTFAEQIWAKASLHGKQILFEAPLPPYDVIASQLHENDDRNFEIEFSESKKGQWDHFEVIAYKTTDDQKSTEGILQDSDVVFPIRVTNQGSFVLYFLQFQTEYTVEIWTVGAHGRKSFRPAYATIKTGGVGEDVETGELFVNNKTNDKEGASWILVYILFAIVAILFMVTIVLTVVLLKHRNAPKPDSETRPLQYDGLGNESPSMNRPGEMDNSYLNERGENNWGGNYTSEGTYNSGNTATDTQYAAPQ